MSLSSSWPRRFENQQSNKLISFDTAAEPLGPDTLERCSLLGFSPLFSVNLYLLWEGSLNSAFSPSPTWELGRTNTAKIKICAQKLKILKTLSNLSFEYFSGSFFILLYSWVSQASIISMIITLIKNICELQVGKYGGLQVPQSIINNKKKNHSIKCIKIINVN